jgi:hypothetical protein
VQQESSKTCQLSHVKYVISDAHNVAPQEQIVLLVQILLVLTTIFCLKAAWLSVHTLVIIQPTEAKLVNLVMTVVKHVSVLDSQNAHLVRQTQSQQQMLFII